MDYIDRISTDSIQNSDLLFEIILDNNLSGEQVFNLFVKWHGCQLCSKNFMENLEAEGVI